MPIHDWTRVQSGLFHEFHQSWSIRIKDALNSGVLTKGYYALVEQKVDGPEPDVIAVEMKKQAKPPIGAAAAILDPPRAAVTVRVASDAAQYARKANRISIRHPLGDVVAVIEMVRRATRIAGTRCGRSWTRRSRSFTTAFTCFSSICFRRPTAIRRGFTKPSGTNSPTIRLNAPGQAAHPRRVQGWETGSPRTLSRLASDSRCRTCRCSWHRRHVFVPLEATHWRDGRSARNRSANSSNRQPHERSRDGLRRDGRLRHRCVFEHPPAHVAGLGRGGGVLNEEKTTIPGVGHDRQRTSRACLKSSQRS